MKKVVSILVAAAFMFGMYAPAFAADWDPYGSVRVATFWSDLDEADTTELDHTLQGNARIGASVDADMIGGHFEYGASGGDANVRLLYGTVDLDQGELKIGRDYSPYSTGSLISGQVFSLDNAMMQYTGYTVRDNMIVYSVEGFSFGLVEPNEYGHDYDTEVQLPRFEIAYDTTVEGVDVNLGAVYQTYDFDEGQEDSLDAWAVTANLMFTEMLDPAYFGIGGYYGQNPHDFGQAAIDYNMTPELDLTAYVDDGEVVEDTDVYAFNAVVGTNIDDIGLEAGFGYLEGDNDGWAEDPEQMTAYGQANIPVTADGAATITPEIGYAENEDHTGDEEEEFYFGLQTRVDF